MKQCYFQKRHWFQSVLVLCAALLLSGCESYLKPYQATAVDVTPVTVSARFTVDDGKEAVRALNRQLAHFVDNNRQGLLAEPVTLFWQGTEAQG